MPALVPHHRFRIEGRHGPLHAQVDATLCSPWTVLFGPSGSGKSTLLRALAGLVPALATSFERHDPVSAAWQQLSHLPSQRRHLGYAPQGADLLPHLTARHNILLPEQLARTSSPSRLQELTKLLHLDPLLSLRPRQLSGGERQRVAIARALAVPDARLLLLDEPFTGFDRALRDELLPGLRAHLAARALPVLSVTHDPDESLLLGADVLRLHDGAISAHGPAHTVLSDEIERLRFLLRGTPHQ